MTECISLGQIISHLKKKLCVKEFLLIMTFIGCGLHDRKHSLCQYPYVLLCN